MIFPTMKILVDLAEELVQRARAAHRRPAFFTIGQDVELQIVGQLALDPDCGDNDWETVLRHGADAMTIKGLPVHRMNSRGIALHTEECLVG